MATVAAPRGTRDVLPGEVERWQQLEALARRVFARFGYREIRTPAFEHTELFTRGIGEATDIVEKEMYTFTDRGGRNVTLRPEGTAPCARAYLEHGMMSWPQPVKLYYLLPMFRYERPQAGRLRQHHQMGAEAFGAEDPALDAEVIALPVEIYRGMGLNRFGVHVNSIGCPACRPAYRERLREYLAPRLGQLCENCKQRYERNPLRVLDCKNEGCRAATDGAPPAYESLCADCSAHLRGLLADLDGLGLSYEMDPRLVRGFDYYTRTVFEVLSEDLGAQNAIAGGGRYDGLVEQLGGPPTPGVGFASGMERALMALDTAGAGTADDGRLDVYVARLGEAASAPALRLTYALRRSGLASDTDYAGRSLKAQLRSASRAGARVAVIIGEEEAAKGIAVVKPLVGDTGSSDQEEVPLDQVVDRLRRVAGLRQEA